MSKVVDSLAEASVEHGAEDLFLKSGLVQSCHDVADGGLFVALAESAMPRGLGFDIMIDDMFRADAYLFGESQSRVVVSVDPADSEDFEDMLNESKLKKFVVLGEVSGGDFIVDMEEFMNVQEAKDLYDNAIGRLMDRT